MGAIVCLMLAVQLGPVLLVSSDENLSGELTYLEDPTAELTFEDIQQVRYHDAFAESPKDVPNFGFTQSAYWFKTSVTNRTTVSDWVIDISYPVVDYVDLFVVREGYSGVKHLRGGDKLPFATRYRTHPSINYHLKLGSGETAHLYFRAQTSGSMQLPVRISSERAFGERAASESIRDGLYYGLILAMVFFNGFLFFATSDRSYVAYCGYLLAYLAVQMSLNGALYQYVFPNAPAIFNAGLPVYLGLVSFFVAVFTSSFLEMRISFPRWNKAAMALAVLSIAVALLSLAVPYRSIIRFSLAIATFTGVFSLIAGIYAWVRGKRIARYFVTAWTVFIAGVLLYSLKSFGILPTNALTTHSVQIGSALEVLLLAMALGDRYELMRHESIQLHKTTLEVQSHLNRELLGKVHIFSDVAHRLNNPLNYVAAGVAAIEDEVQEVQTTVHGLLAEEEGEQDPEVGVVRTRFDGNFDRIEKMLEQVVIGQSRASRFVEELRGLNEIDGKALEPVSMGTVVAMAEKRLVDDLGVEGAARIKLHFESAEVAQQEVVGNRYLLALAFESLIEQLLETRVDRSSKVSVLNIRYVSNHDDLLAMDVATALTTNEYQSLIRAFHANSVEPSMEGRFLVLARGLFEEQGGSLELRERPYEGTAEVIMQLSLPATRVKAAHAVRGY